ncbi:MAG: hypothetical protein PSV16_00420, partial [Flavobacterium sp.]|nr:hypothetical protein [Flavobacterium sp.]
AVAPICSGATLAALPTTSNNGITGTWSPALNNTATTTYMFMPDENQCALMVDLIIVVNPSPIVDEINNVAACESFTLPILTSGTYYTQPNGSGELLHAGDIITNSQTVYVFKQEGDCSAESSFVITIGVIDVDHLNDIFACDNYTLSPLVNGNYFTEPNGQGLQLNANDVITDSQTIYVFAQSGICTAESSFVVTIMPTPVVATQNDVVVCDSYTLPALTNGNYYTASNGQGTMLNANDVITDSQTIYVFVQNGICSAESSFVITITPTPVVPSMNDVVACNSYNLPALANGNYYTASNGQGTMLNANDVI